MRKLNGIAALLAGLALMFSAGAVPVSADPGNGNGNGNGQANDKPAKDKAAADKAGNSQVKSGGGNNGTVKIQEAPTTKHGNPNTGNNTETDSERANDPKVCDFTVRGFGFDAHQSGHFYISPAHWEKPSDASDGVGQGVYDQAWNDGNDGRPGDGNWESPVISGRTLVQRAGGVNHFKLFFRTTEKNDGNFHYKHKVFKVECDTESGSTTGTGTGTGSSSTGTGTSSTTTTTGTGSSADTATTGTTGGSASNNGLSNNSSNNNVSNGSNNNGMSLDLLGFENAPLGQVELVQPVVAGSEAAPSELAAIASLPATATSPNGALGLVGLAATAIGAALLRRPVRRSERS